MNKIPTPVWPSTSVLIVAVVCLFLSGIAGCGNNNDDHHPGGGRDSIVINEDSVRNHIIPISEAIAYTKAFQAAITESGRIRPDLKIPPTFAHAEEFPSDLFYALLEENNPKQGKARGIRIYLGSDSSGNVKMVLVPVDSLGNDMIGKIIDLKGKPMPKAHALSLQADGGQAGEAGQYCPTVCDGGGSGLNQ